MIDEMLSIVVFIGGRRMHPITEAVVVVIFFSLSLAFVIWFERDKRRRGWKEPDSERPPVFAALEILQPAILSFILICIALMVMMWLLARSN
jgi:hypothetical protein